MSLCWLRRLLFCENFTYRGFIIDSWLVAVVCSVVVKPMYNGPNYNPVLLAKGTMSLLDDKQLGGWKYNIMRLVQEGEIHSGTGVKVLLRQVFTSNHVKGIICKQLHSSCSRLSSLPPTSINVQLIQPDGPPAVCLRACFTTHKFRPDHGNKISNFILTFFR